MTATFSCPPVPNLSVLHLLLHLTEIAWRPQPDWLCIWVLVSETFSKPQHVAEGLRVGQWATDLFRHQALQATNSAVLSHRSQQVCAWRSGLHQRMASAPSPAATVTDATDRLQQLGQCRKTSSMNMYMQVLVMTSIHVQDIPSEAKASE